MLSPSFQRVLFAMIVALFGAMAIVALITPLVRWFALKVGAVSHPGGRHVHAASIPRLGGTGICFAFLVTMLSLYAASPSVRGLFSDPTAGAGRAPLLRAIALVVGGVAMCGVGLADDIRPLRAIYKLGLQIAVACFAWGMGLTISVLHLPLVGDLPMDVLGLPVTILWFVGVMNAVNLIDGLDGLAAGVVLFAALTNFIVACIGGAWNVALLSAATGGAVFGFLFHNWNPARIFMGDSGSYFLGYILAATALVGTSQKATTAVSLLAPMIALGVPIFDTLFAMVRRVLERRSVFSPDRGHIHHRLLDMGITHRRAVMIIYAVCVVFMIAAIGTSLDRAAPVGIALALAVIAVVGLVRFLGYFEYLHSRVRQRSRFRSRDAEMLRFAIPKVPAAFAAASDEEELFDAVIAFAIDADLEQVDVLVPSSEGEERIFRYRKPDNLEDTGARGLLTARYPLGRDEAARAAVVFGWIGDTGDVAPQTEILLQVATDVLVQALTRLRSRLAPLPTAGPPHANAEDGSHGEGSSFAEPHLETRPSRF